MTDPQLHAMLDTLCDGFADRLGVRGRDFTAVVRRAGRRVPRRLRPAAATLAEAEMMSANPRLARLVDTEQFRMAATDLQAWLDTQDPRERRKTQIINMAALIAFYILVTALGVVIFVVWRGLV